MTDIKIHIPEASTEDNSLREELKDIGSRSTVHGISNVISTPSVYKKILWIIAFLTCTGLVIRQLVDIFTLYRSNPVKTTFKLELNKEFPSITICNMKRYIQQNEDLVLNRAYTLAVEEYRMGNFTPQQLIELCQENMTMCDFIQHVDNFTRHLISKYEENMVYLTLIVYCYQGGTMKESCNISYTWMSTIYGNCATFEPSDKLANIYGLGGEVKIAVNLENQYGFLSLTSGVRVVVHAKDTLPLAFEEGVTIKGGDEAFIGIKMTETQRLGHPYSNCLKNDTFNGGKYTTKTCMTMCWERVLLNKCGCIITETESLSYRTAEVRPPECALSLIVYTCYVDLREEFLNNPGSFCDCPAACTEQIYEMQVSSSKAFDLTDQKSLTDLNMLLQMSCTGFYGAEYLGGCPLDSVIQTDTNFVKLHFYLRDPMHETRQEEPLYGESQMLADIGGSLGLFIGASVLSLGEIIEVLYVLLNALCWKKRNRTTTDETGNE